MIIDAHAHFTGPPQAITAFRGSQLGQLARPRTRGQVQVSDDDIRRAMQRRLKRMEASGIDRLIFSPGAGQMGHHFGNERISRAWAQVNNDLIGRVCRLYPDKLIPVGMLPESPGFEPKGWLEELERCATEWGFVGFLINPDPSGGLPPLTPSLADEWWYPLWEKMTQLDVAGMIHVDGTLLPAFHSRGSYYIAHHHNAVVELCNSRVFEDFPTLRLIIPHGGGAIPYQFNRHRALHIDEGRPPFEEVVKNLYFDMAIYDQDSMEMMIRKFGTDNVLFASEMLGAVDAVDPNTGKDFDDTLHLVLGIEWLTDEDRYKLFEGNARKVFTRAKF